MADEISKLVTRIERLAPIEGCWRIESMRISSTTGWMIQREAPLFLANPLAEGTLRGGRPVVLAASSARS